MKNQIPKSETPKIIQITRKEIKNSAKESEDSTLGVHIDSETGKMTLTKLDHSFNKDKFKIKQFQCTNHVACSKEALNLIKKGTNKREIPPCFSCPIMEKIEKKIETNMNSYLLKKIYKSPPAEVKKNWDKIKLIKQCKFDFDKKITNAILTNVEAEIKNNKVETKD